MSAREKHLQQYRHNKSFLTEVIANNEEYADWSVTAIFYCGVHLVESVLAKHGQDIERHFIRNKAVNSLDDFKSCAKEYQTLYDKSIAARYHCVKMKQKHINLCVDCLSKIEEVALDVSENPET